MWNWHQKFAWWPVKLSLLINEAPGYSRADAGRRAWLQWVEQNDNGDYRLIEWKWIEALELIARLDPHNSDLLEAQNYARAALAE